MGKMKDTCEFRRRLSGKSMNMKFNNPNCLIVFLESSRKLVTIAITVILSASEESYLRNLAHFWFERSFASLRMTTGNKWFSRRLSYYFNAVFLRPYVVPLKSA